MNGQLARNLEMGDGLRALNASVGRVGLARHVGQWIPEICLEDASRYVIDLPFARCKALCHWLSGTCRTRETHGTFSSFEMPWAMHPHRL